MKKKRPSRRFPGIRPVARSLYEALALDVWPSPAASTDFGIASQEHYEALQAAVASGEVTLEELDDALGNGPFLTELVRVPSNPHPGIVFTTPYDRT